MFSLGNRCKKILVAVLGIAIISASFPGVFLRRASAIVTPPLIVLDPTVTATLAATQAANLAALHVGWLEEVLYHIQKAWEFIQKYVLDALLASLKKRLLDEITNETIQWIQNGKTPVFTQNFGDVFRTAADQAAGDVLQNLGEGQLCTGLPQKLYNLQLTQPQPLRQSVSCTLSQVVGNIEAFKQNFSQGGWVGYQDLLMPQNNQYGIMILTQQALQNELSQKTQSAVLLQQVNQGFNIKQCTTWRLYEKATNQPVPNSDENVTDQPPSADPALEYRCVEEKVTTPGRTVADSVSKALGSNIDFIVNTNDLSNALGMVLDAAFNRLMKAGVSGLASFTQSSGKGIDSSTLGNALTDYSQGRNITINTNQSSLSDSLSKLIAQASSTLRDASDTLVSASSSAAYLYQTAFALKDCLGPNASSTDIAWATSTMALASSTYPAQITQQRADVAREIPLVQNLTPEYSNKNAIDAAVSAATKLKSDATTLSNAIESNVAEAQNRLSACINTTHTSL